MDDGAIEATGRLIDMKCGLYAARVQSLSKKDELGKHLGIIGPQDIGLNKESGEFKITIPFKDGAQYEAANLKGAFYNLEDPRIFQIYVAPQSNDKIPYGAPNTDRLKPGDLQLAMTLPME
jgi:hypothetical protein